MSLRPVPARWFELLTTREQVAHALEVLAATGAIELEFFEEAPRPSAMAAVQDQLDEYHRLAQRYQAYWPQAGGWAVSRRGQPAELLARALEQLRAWCNEAAPRIRELEALQGERDTLQLLREMLRGLAQSPLDLRLLAHSALGVRCWAFPLDAPIPAIPATLISRQVQGTSHQFLLVIGPNQALAELEQALSAQQARNISLPAWIAGDASTALAAVEQRMQILAARIADLKSELEALDSKHQLAQALGIIARVEWFHTTIGSLAQSENFSWVSGWTNDLSGTRLEAALQSARIPALLRFPPPPEGKRPPMIFANPWWARPFELLTRLLGTPGQNEADPTPILSLLAPLLFGYMFGDLGQGFVLLLAGFLLKSRWPALRLLIPAGIFSMIFGLLFGSVFSLENLINPLWLHPLEAPLTVLLVPLIGGIGILVLGMILDAYQGLWRGDWEQWLWQGAPMLLLYLGILASFLEPLAAAPAFIGLLWYLIGALQSGGRLKGLALALGRLVENTMQLVINTLSFARVGAFALAHAGLSLAIVLLAEASAHPLARLLVLILGNVLVIVLEGAVVSVQTTRLILFEFFIRFWRGQGRAFRPILPPDLRERGARYDIH
ncbi:V-type ATP synthase subunit I [Thermithiobacillus plumbiphilus]|uniref:V-type ATPase 116kDa subunit family protein n=1 Tax=Thermithiobacillus plumbiphilus TaxID=1729899 RepID=A0ABU9D6C2_9PROT